MSSLYELTQEVGALEALLQETGGDVTDESQAAMIEQWQQEFDWAHRAKVDGYAKLIKNAEADIDAIKKEGERLAARAQALRNKIQRLKDLAKYAMDSRGLKKLEGITFTLAIQKNGGKAPLEILVKNPEVLPEQYRIVTTTVEPNKDALREALEKGDKEAESYARLLPVGESVRIR